MMNTHTLQIRMQAEAATMERLCQVIRVRGFELLNMQASQHKGLWDINVTIRGERPLPMLRAQVDKLHGVRRCD